MSMKVETNSEYYVLTKSPENRTNSEIVIFDFEQKPNDNLQIDKTKKAKASAERQKALKMQEGTPGSLKYYKKKENWLFKDRKAYYEYIATGTERLFQIINKFGLKKDALFNCNRLYKTDEESLRCIPDKGTKINFYSEDIE